MCLTVCASIFKFAAPRGDAWFRCPRKSWTMRGTNLFCSRAITRSFAMRRSVGFCITRPPRRWKRRHARRTESAARGDWRARAKASILWRRLACRFFSRSIRSYKFRAAWFIRSIASQGGAAIRKATARRTSAAAAVAVAVAITGTVAVMAAEIVVAAEAVAVEIDEKYARITAYFSLFRHICCIFCGCSNYLVLNCS